MTYRRFTDPQGSLWEAWEVHPMVVERRVNAERRSSTRDDADRRKQQEFRLVIPRELSRGWLAVQSAVAKVRVTPIPPGWMDLSDHELADLVARSSRSEQAAS